ncbi:hypothetical protein A3I27_04155 [Candidatus Giovannonibacteria bacterium RIFCSPLOWO2_02_FULL_43_11b]|uniref:Cell division protein FtsX n=1 Tax=Candidatus Giovannonibacteria bacterium RIFCSPHIGHO2_12_FULL_43_15 TaxID=1798341 RepID=A0A1F5WQM8_9BACT|nr:MAG: hypothetical protein A2739_02135 [Candidatus Giovannonibacteria bacterium RIFCSPHIGHO2_01_FULL_43_100]OGF67119.1 MAG: hypothetical protein A3B97_04270 [Candidatus Giovannonibacteria bacterium RIFCSPHIGHO2_02_FULL_43_32]OGF77965.1 MAG: hypothetical protein A3F23_03970 [Candidatus Giovannonibacteria bacterium RIFCSPHIGHO2_12_FULL_43_15]OGF79317.1 MAG: hypothetical protein A3A15_01615 [Candidatus Giovannonibacteria bacterium RIFCSPLOWO2_01_FULL_43_60]OGF89293.1 MAG: hypothetical protein A3
MLIQIKRNIVQGFVNFWRNGWVSLATVLIMVVTLFVFGSLFFSNVILTSSLDKLAEKVDINVYFKVTANNNEINDLKSSLEKLPEIKQIELISRDQALKNFQEKHKENALITQSLDELGDNPLGASLNIAAKDPNQYESISRFLESQNYESIVDKVNYHENKKVIDGLNSMIKSSRTSGFTSTIVLGIIAILVAFNTIRLAIYTSKDEISIMRLVGATNAYIRGPFVMEGIIHGILAAVITMAVFWLPLSFGRDNIVLLFLPFSPIPDASGVSTSEFYGGPNLFNYYISNFFVIFLLLLVLGVAIGVISSLIATRRYLRV